MKNSRAKSSSTLVLLAVRLLAASGLAAQAGEAISTARIESFPREGQGYQLIDWHQRSEDFLRFTLDPVRQGDYLPLMWWDDSKVNWKETTFGLPSYVGMKGQWGVFRNAHEGIVTMGSVISGALLGQDMTRYVVPGNEQPINLVRMQEAYFSPEDGVFLDGIGSRSGNSLWYDLTPNIFAGALVAAYPQEEALSGKWCTACRSWAEATLQMWHLNDFNFQGYDLRAKRAVVRQWREPDSAAALAYLMQMAHAKWPQEQIFYHESRHALDWLCAQKKNPNYEFFPVLGVYAAARMNAEQRTTYDVGKIFRWCFEESAVRGIGPHETDISKGDGYGVVSGRWGQHDVAGLVGCSRGALSTPKMLGGYVFPMETFMYSWALVPAVRYDTRLARAVGKWMHAAAHSLRLVYPDQLPPELQSDWAWASKYTTAIPYEGLMEKNNVTGAPGPFASGDPTNQGWVRATSASTAALSAVSSGPSSGPPMRPAYSRWIVARPIFLRPRLSPARFSTTPTRKQSLSPCRLAKHPCGSGTPSRTRGSARSPNRAHASPSRSHRIRRCSSSCCQPRANRASRMTGFTSAM